MSTYIEQYARVLGDPGVPEWSQWYFYCPFEGCDGYTKRRFTVNPETGVWYCLHCNHHVEGREKPGGTWRDFVRELGDEANIHLWPEVRCEPIRPKIPPLPAGQAEQIWSSLVAWQPTPKLIPAHAAHLESRGINGTDAGIVTMRPKTLIRLCKAFGQDMVTRAGLLFPRAQGQLLPRTCVQSHRMLIPYMEGESVRYFVGYSRCPSQRPDQTDADYQRMKDDWVKCAGPYDYHTQVYGTVPEDAPYLVVMEAQLKAIAADQVGFPSVGLPGIGSCHAALVRLCLDRRVQRVIICFDTESNPKTVAIVDEAAERLAREFLRHKIPTYRALLPLDPGVDGGRKMDTDSFITSYGREEFAQVLAEAASRPYIFKRSWTTTKKNKEAA